MLWKRNHVSWHLTLFSASSFRFPLSAFRFPLSSFRFPLSLSPFPTCLGKIEATLIPYVNAFCECVLKKIGLTHAHFQYNSMMYSSRKLNNKKVITTACNFWRQIACSFYGRTNHFSSRLEKLCFEFPAFFHLTNTDVTSCFFRQFFRPLYEDEGQKIAIFNCEYLGDTCFNWAETS